MIIVVYFTGLGGTIAQMSSMLWYLAKYPQYQNELAQELRREETASIKNELLGKIMREALRIFPTTLTIDRPTEREVVVEYTYGDQRQEIIIPPKSIITFFQPWAKLNCQNPEVFNPNRVDQIEIYPFGNGVHRCVGEMMARELMERMAKHFTLTFASSTDEEEIETQGFFNYEAVRDIFC